MKIDAFSEAMSSGKDCRKMAIPSFVTHSNGVPRIQINIRTVLHMRPNLGPIEVFEDNLVLYWQSKR